MSICLQMYEYNSTIIIFRKGDNICDFLFAFPYKIGSTPKGKNLLIGGANSFFLRIDPYRDGRLN